jgi:glycosyltransferase involved in cell wall biosynthesis
MRVLVISPSLPYPPIWGFNIRVFQILSHLARRNAVSLLCYGDPSTEDEAAAREALAGICEEVFTVPDVKLSRREKRRRQAWASLGPRSFHLHRYFSPQMQTKITELLGGGRFGLVQVESGAMAGFDFGRTPIVLDEHNLEYELLRRGKDVNSSIRRRIFTFLESGKVEREEISAWRKANGCVFTSRRDEAIANARVPGLHTAVVPNGVALDYFRPMDAAIKPGCIVFTGLMRYRPNSDGFSYFVREIFPAVRMSRPDATFTAVGWGLTAEIEHLLGNGVSHTGRVDDVRPYLATASVVVAPLRIGSGTRLKILEGLAMGKAVVSTSIGCEGLDVKHGEHVLIADDPGAFAESVLSLLNDPAGADALGRRGRALVERLYGWDRAVGELERFHQSVFAPGNKLAGTVSALQ